MLVFGGSQGALHLDETVAAAARGSRATGRTSSSSCRRGRTRGACVARRPGREGFARADVLPFLERMELAYAVADLAVTRAGASNIAEMTVCGVPMLLIPYPFATENHQEANARELERAGAARRACSTRT